MSVKSRAYIYYFIYVLLRRQEQAEYNCEECSQSTEWCC